MTGSGVRIPLAAPALRAAARCGRSCRASSRDCAAIGRRCFGVLLSLRLLRAPAPSFGDLEQHRAVLRRAFARDPFAVLRILSIAGRALHVTSPIVVVPCPRANVARNSKVPFPQLWFPRAFGTNTRS